MESFEEEDEFDWEAAVREIDLACQKNTSSASSSVPPLSAFLPSSSHFAPTIDAFVRKSNLGGPVFGNGGKHVATKQSTLDKFIGSTTSIPPPESRIVPNLSTYESVDGDDKNPCVDIDPEAAKTWIYPVNVPLRDYQFSITKTALFSNTLVALPTGLGKTLIAAVVMYNYFRWFPEGKIVFAAPSRPLVVQQIEACHNIVGIPQEWTIDMTGQTSPSKRAFLWKSKRVFFVTPQVLEKDIQSGTCLVNCLVCLIIDEAHRALGNYSYCVVVRELMAVPVKLRILALSATPGSKTQAIQGIIDNLQISTLEYRNETDDDVSPYVHNRKVELIEVPLGRDADDINKHLLDVIRPYAARLNSFGLIQNRDYQTLSPCDLLTARDKFRRAPPPDLPHVNHGNVEACFAALITLYHIRKLLLSHGIRPAYEMLEEKLQQGSFARLMSKNEDIRKAKLLMQCSLSQGAPSPKLSKMLEVLDDHFKIKDPKTSRVIVFSNFRGSVRDIMDALYNIGDVVKATEFIGQSSGKTLKGQSQKVQQAVLEKFRAGGFNVIVATSIGEEGLDIMEVDLVICFDANVSPLRMIQRMGRTGRKHDGRVVVLACEGSELKAYTRKQANGRSIKKHMRNGGMNSFSFHPSPRMIPHVFKPEVQFVELSVKQFVPRGKKLKEDVNPAIETPAFQRKLTPAETDLLAKYFDRDGGNKWRPSLIAFPLFQASPSKVHNVVHSHRTGMFIDAMQCLQDATFSETNKSFFTELQDKAPSSKKEGFDAALQIGDDTKDLLFFGDLQVNASQTNAKVPATSPTSTLVTAEKEYEESLPTHQYPFASECASVDALGKAFVMPVPGSLSVSAPHSKCTALTKTGYSCLSAPHIDLIMEASQARHLQDSISCGFKQIDDGKIMILSDDDNFEDDELGLRLTNFIKSGVVPDSPDYNQGTKENNRENEKEADPPKLSSPVVFNIESGVVPDSPIYDEWSTKENSREEEEEADAPKLSSPFGFNIESNLVPDSPVYDQGTTKEDNREEEEEADPSKLSSPVGFNIESSVVPDSPIYDQENNRGKVEEVYPPKHSSPVRFNSDLTSEPSGPKRKNEEGTGGDPQDTSTSNELKTTQKRKDLESERKCVIVSPVPGEWRTPLADLSNSSANKDWRLSSGENSEKFEQPRKLKRLRKLGECAANMKENCSDIANVNRAKSRPRTGFLGKKHFGGKRNCLDDEIRVFIDEEAEVSSEAEMSADEKDDAADNSYEESFIDDRSNPTSSTQADSGKVDMMAIYRRSLLSQSPLPRRLFGVTASSPSPVSVGSLRTINENQSSSDRSLKTMSGSSGRNQNTITTGDITREHDSTTRETRKRKLGLYNSVNAPVINLDSKFASLEHSETVRDNEGALDKGNNEDDNDDNDDSFYEMLDFEAVEAQAAMLLKERSDVGLGAMDERYAEATGKDLRCDGVEENDKPCFDLGLW